MTGRRAVERGAGWGTVMIVVFVGLAIAALVALTPWHVRDLRGTGDGTSTKRDTVVEVRAPNAAGLTRAVPLANVSGGRHAASR